LPEPDALQLNIRFDHPGIDELAKMKRVPQQLSYIKEILGITKGQSGFFESLFTEEAHRV